MREVLGRLAAGQGVTAFVALELGRFPAAMLPSAVDQQLLIDRASHRLRAFISRTSGIHAPRDPRAHPDDPRCAFRLAATWRAEGAIDDMARRHLQIARLAVAFYPTLRERMDHAAARDSAIRRASLCRPTRRAPHPRGRRAAVTLFGSVAPFSRIPACSTTSRVAGCRARNNTQATVPVPPSPGIPGHRPACRAHSPPSLRPAQRPPGRPDLPLWPPAAPLTEPVTSSAETKEHQR